MLITFKKNYMKKVLFSIATIGIFIACNTNPKTETTTTTVIPAISNTDSINRAQADKNQSVQMNGVSDTIIGSDGQMYIKAKQGAEPTTQAAPPARVPKTPRKMVRNKPLPIKNSTNNGSSNNNTNNQGSGNNGTGSTANNGSGTGTETTTQTEEPKKKGWSNAAKGTAIGAAGGAVAGAVISKNKGVGAVVGGLIGAGGGYIIGRKKDKKKQQADSTANQ